MNKITIHVKKDSSVDSLSKAFDKARDLREDAGSYLPLDIIVHEGEYKLEPLTLSKADQKISLIAAEGEKPLITGGIRLDLAKAEKVVDESVLSRIIEKSSRDNLYQLDISDIIDSICRARDSFDKGSFDFYRNGTPMYPARWPSKRAGINPAAEGDYLFAPQIFHDDPSKTTPFHIKIDIPTADHIRRFWSEETLKNLCVTGYLWHNWHFDSYKISSIDTDNLFVHSVEGNQSYTAYNEPVKYRRYYFRNVLEEITDNNEYYIDYEKKILYFLNLTENDEIIFPVADKPLFTVNGADMLTVKGLTVMYTRANIFNVRNTSCVSISECEFAHSSGTAIDASEVPFFKVFRNHIYDFGFNGVYVSATGDTRNLTKGNVQIFENDIHNVGRKKRIYCPAIGTDGSVGTLISKNKLHDSPHLLIYASGVDTLIEGNELYNAVLDTDDASAIYWGRTPDSVGTVIRKNYFHDIGQDETATWSISAIYNDDCATSCEICENIFDNSAIFGDSYYRRGDHKNVTVCLNGAAFCSVHNNLFIMSTELERPMDDLPNEELGGWLTHCIGAYIKENTSQNWRWDEIFTNMGLFVIEDGKRIVSEKWKAHYKGTMWETMLDVLDTKYYYAGGIDENGNSFGIPELTEKVKAKYPPERLDDSWRDFEEYIFAFIKRDFAEKSFNSFCNNVIVGMNDEFLKDGDSVEKIAHSGNIYCTKNEATELFEDFADKKFFPKDENGSIASNLGWMKKD